MRRIKAILSGVLLYCITLYSQDQQYQFSNIDKTNGLSHNRVQCFYRDSKGFLWIGTIEGLCRFNGYEFKIYYNNQADSNSLRDNSITNLFEDNEGNLWVANGEYLDIYNPQTETFTRVESLFNNRVKVPHVSQWFHLYDLDGNIIYANDSSGLYKYIVARDSVFKISFPYFDSTTSISGLSMDNTGNIWMACTNAKLYKLQRYNYSIIDRINLEKKLTNLYRVYTDSDNDIWIFDKYNASGIFMYNVKEMKLHSYNTQSVGLKLNNNSITGIVQDDNGLIWVSTDHGGLNIIDKKLNQVRYVTRTASNERGLCDNTLTTIYKDYQGFIWTGSFKKGFSYYHSNLFTFNSYNIQIDDSEVKKYNDIDNFVEDKKGNIWIGTNGGGLIYFDRQHNTFRQFINNPLDPYSLSTNIIIGMYVDKKDQLWAGTYFGGLNLYNGKYFERFKNDPSDPTTISDDRIWDICEDHEGNLWIATLLGGVNIFDPMAKKVIKTFRWDSDSSIRGSLICSVMEDKDHLMWFATSDGLRSYNPETNKFTYYDHDENNPLSLSRNFVYEVMQDSRGDIWVGTMNGLNKLIKGTKNFKIFKKEDGLPSNFILTIIEDNNHNLWLSTSHGLSNLIITPVNSSGDVIYSFKNYDVFDGLQSNEFNEKAAFKTREGELLFGGANGFNMFYPDIPKAKNIPSTIVLTDLQINNQSISNKDLVNGKQILKYSITYTNEITLSHKESIFSIEFADINFLHPNRLKYRYMLENFNNNWMYTDQNNRKATYTNLNPGRYIFRVNSTNTDGNWNDYETWLIINILPPWWKTLIFRIALVIISISLIIIFYYLRLYNLRNLQIALENKVKERTNQLSEANALLEQRQEEISLQNEELNRHRYQLEQNVKERTAELEKALQKAEESDKLKSAFLANMSHEIRTPMNAIVGFSKMLGDEDLPETKRSEYIEIIYNNCDALLVLINDILDISKIEANQVKIYKMVFNVNQLLEELEYYFNLTRKENVDIKFIRNKKVTPLILYNDPIRFRQVISNLIDNAKKYTSAGIIQFGFTIKKTKVEFYVADSGIGIHQSDIGKLFDHFTKIEHSTERLYRGTGLGLAICKKIIELMGGKIWVQSEYGKGSTFYFILPYNPNEIIREQKVNKKVKKTFASIDGFTILVAEDEPTNFYLIEGLLRLYNVKMIWAKNGREVLEYVKKLPHYKNLLILMDIKMPIMNGIDALNKIKKIDPDIPIIAITAYAQESEKYDILKNDFNDFITKPLKPEILLDAITRNIQLPNNRSKKL